MTEADRRRDDEIRAVIAFYASKLILPQMPATNMEIWAKRISELIATLPSLAEAKQYKLGN